jgi:predicted methyltransferase
MNSPRALSEMFRVLKPGGRLWVTLHPWSMTARDLLKSCKRFDARRVGSRLMVMANGLTVMTVGVTLPLPFRNGGTESFQTRRGITRHLHRVGFDDVEFAQGESFTVSAKKSTRGR